MKTKMLGIVATLMWGFLQAYAVQRHWTVADGLPMGEIRQIIELPNGQMLVNCEGAFCLSNGQRFTMLPCERNRTFHLENYAKGYAHLWQGDSLLWLRDFYRIYLFDARLRCFRYDVQKRLGDDDVRRFVADGVKRAPWTTELWHFVVAQNLSGVATCATSDRQGGVWVGTQTDGIYYYPPQRDVVRTIRDDAAFQAYVMQMTDSQGRTWLCRQDGLLCTTLQGRQTLYHSGNVEGMTHVHANFITELPDHRLLLCYTLHELGYFDPDRRVFTSLNVKIPALSQYRYFVGACPVDERWTAVYTQNGAFLLDIKADTVTTFPCAEVIENYSDKYNCMLSDNDGRLWVGTQNGLFFLKKVRSANGGTGTYLCERIEGILNNCIRSLVMDADSNVWVGTSCGVSRITPSVINLGCCDGIPAASMNERAATLSPDGNLMFIHGQELIMFHPDSIIQRGKPLLTQLLSVSVNDSIVSPEDIVAELLRFSYNENRVAFQFSALNYAASSHTRYRYRLAGLESDWHLCSNAVDGLCAVEYRALQPGSYILEAQAATDGGEWGKVMRKAFVIHPPFWLTWWAKLFYGLFVIGIVYWLIRLYLKNKKAKMERENDARVNHLFELREEARHQFAESTKIEPRKISVSGDEEQLAERMLRAIEIHMADTDYGVDQLAQDVSMSRSALYTKLRNMLGVTPSDFIRNVRLKHAAQLLAETSIPINEIAYRVGYNTHKAFSSNFKKLFGLVPSEYREGKKSS